MITRILGNIPNHVYGNYSQQQIFLHTTRGKGLWQPRLYRHKRQGRAAKSEDVITG